MPVGSAGPQRFVELFDEATAIDAERDDQVLAVGAAERGPADSEFDYPRSVRIDR